VSVEARPALAFPALRLLAIGAALIVAVRAWPSTAPSAAPRTIATLVAAAPPGASPANDDEILFRAGAAAVAADDPVVEARLVKLARYLELGGTAEESDAELAEVARGLGLAGEDVVIRRYLVEAARLALEHPAPADLPDEDELRAYYERNGARFAAPARVRATHVYLSAARRGEALAADAARVLNDLNTRAVGPWEAAALGDPFVRGAVIDGPRDAVARSFGPEFAGALESVAGGSWQGPIESAYGLHLVWVVERAPAAPPPLDVVRGRVLHTFLRERGAARVQQRLAALRCRATAEPGCVS